MWLVVNISCSCTRTLETMQFDDFYATIDSFGRYQKVKYFLICLTYMFPPIMVYTWSFTAATPSFECLPSSDDMRHNSIPSESQCRQYRSQLSLSECQRCFRWSNTSDEPMRACTNFVFSRTYYQSTLVEEVNVFFRRNQIDSKQIFLPF